MNNYKIARQIEIIAIFHATGQTIYLRKILFLLKLFLYLHVQIEHRNFLPSGIRLNALAAFILRENLMSDHAVS